MSVPVLSIRNLSIALPSTAERALAVSELDLDVEPDEIVCLVGESGSGKTMAIRAVMGLLPVPRVRVVGGSIRLSGEEVTRMPPERLREMRGAAAAMIFQEPMTALNPLMTVGAQIDEMIWAHEAMPRGQRRARVIELLGQVHLPDPMKIYEAYPHQLSGGQRQRCIIAMALALSPRLLVADEPTTALDVTTQAQILRLIRELQERHRTGVLFITHDFGVVAEIADRVGVMREGQLVEFGTRDDVLMRPRHDYTRKLIDAVPDLLPRRRDDVAGRPVALSVNSLCKSFSAGRRLFGTARKVDAVRDVSFDVRRGETMGIVGESGSG
jgi:peptide/nickel transport system ATP-binding protein